MNTGQYDYGHFYDGEAKNYLGEQVAPDDMENQFRALAKLWRQYKQLRIVPNKKNVTTFKEITSTDKWKNLEGISLLLEQMHLQLQEFHPVKHRQFVHI